MKLSKWILGGMMAVAVAGAVACYAGTFTNHGVTSTSRTLDETAVATEDLSVLDDYSDYPRYLGRHGTIIRVYSFDTFGAQITSAIPIDMGHTRQYISDNTIIWDGFIDVTTPVLPDTATVALGINTANDILAATTNLSIAAKRQIIPVGTVATCVQATNNMPFKVTFAAATPTSGVFFVYMDAYLGQ